MAEERGRLSPKGESLSSPFRVRHHGGTLIVTTRRRRPVPRQEHLRVRGWVPAGLLLMLATTLLVTGVPLDGHERAGPCPDRLSQALSSGGRTLRVRPEPPVGDTRLIHLCAESAVRKWSVAINGIATPVQPVSDRLALAAAPTGHRLTVTTVLTSGGTVRFGFSF
ncbi:hypothetical protein Areg01_66990 [Actinoplanes regularis]|nr:hypothetical protein Areg01_66990 [Actinoplanes regularis]